MKKLYLDLLLFNPTFYAAVAVILLLERWRPADRRQATFSVALAQDFLWLLVETGLKSLVIATWMVFVAELYYEHLSFLSVTVMQEWPAPVRIAVSVVVADFIGWFQHWLRHKVPWFWEFHKIHHAQTELNLFSDARLHIADWTVAATLRYLLMLILGVEPPTSVYFELVTTWYTRAYHANLRTNFGPLRYFIVSPQFHRVHHSADPSHRDTNYAVLFPVWDYLFRTKSPDDEVYPATGVDDRSFPPEPTSFGLRLPLTLLWQMVYPFYAIAVNTARAFGRAFAPRSRPAP